MTDETTEAETTATEAQAQPVSAEISLDVYCVALSARLRAPELVAGFKHTQRIKHAFKATAAGYDAAFDAFCKTTA